MRNFINECDNGIWFREEDPDDELYNPKYCRNVYIDNIIGKFDYYDIKKSKLLNKERLYTYNPRKK